MIGVLGGTFDPIHFGHLRPALDLVQGLGLHQVRLVPVNRAVHRAQPEASGALRLEMVRAAVAGEPALVADSRELDRPGGSYSYDTLCSVRQELGAREPLCLLVGSDAFADFLCWHRPESILELAHLVVMDRPGVRTSWSDDLRRWAAERMASSPAQLKAAPAGRILEWDVTRLDISATAIRALVAAGHSPRYLAPNKVLDIIEREGLYGRTGPAPPGDIAIHDRSRPPDG